MNNVDKTELNLSRLNYWKSKSLYLDLLQKFILEKIDGTEFSDAFFYLWRADRDRDRSSPDLLNELQNQDFKKLGPYVTIINELFNDREVFEPDPALREHYEISEEELRNQARKAYFILKNFF